MFSLAIQGEFNEQIKQIVHLCTLLEGGQAFANHVWFCHTLY